MTIIVLKDKDRKLPVRAIIRRKGHPVLMKHFLTKAEAKHWEREQEREIRIRGLPLTIDELKKHTVKEIVTRYLEEVTPQKGCAESEALVLKKFLRTDLAAKSLAYVSKQDGYAYINARRKDTWKHPLWPNGSAKPIEASTVKREVGSIQHVFEVAREQWGFTNLVNPFRGIPIKGIHRRKRRLNDGELNELLIACRKCLRLNRFYVPLAIYLAVETAMRLQEIFNLTWQDLDFKGRRIEIRKSKTDHVSEYQGRTIVMSINARIVLIALHDEIKPKLTDRVFPKSKNAFKQAWADVRKRAKITGLTFHDLRREAGSRFDEAELTTAEHNLMLGHTSKDMSGVYIASKLKRIQDKLDRHFLGEKTWEELEPNERKRLMDKVLGGLLGFGGGLLLKKMLAG